jgi:hypothetical protein
VPTAAAGVVLSTLTTAVPATCAQAEVSPLSTSDYSERPACARAAEGSASCLALQLVPVTAAARAQSRPLVIDAAHAMRTTSAAAEGTYGLRPQDFHSAYNPPSSLRDITSGSNRECRKRSTADGEPGCTSAQEAASCSARAICLTGAGYRGAAGCGAPNWLDAFVGGSGAIETGAVGQQNGSDAGGGLGAAAVSDAGSDPPPATGRHHCHATRVACATAVKLSDLRLTAGA